MRSIAVSLTSAVIVAVLVWFALGWIAALIPLLLVFGGVQFFMTRRIGQFVEAELKAVPALLGARKIAEADAVLVGVAKRWGPWQPMLTGQLEGQRGLLLYVQMKFDEALPMLKRGTFQNWMAHASIACIYWRKGQKADAIKSFEAAAGVSAKESMIYVLWGVLLYDDGQAPAAATALGRGLTALPGHSLLSQLHKAVANKGKVDRARLPETWLQFWPEDLAKQMRVGGRKGGPDPRFPVQATPKLSAKNAPRR